MIQHMRNTKCVGIAVHDTIHEIEWVRNQYKGPIYTNKQDTPTVRRCKTFAHAISAVSRDADITIAWAMSDFAEYVRSPLVYLIQNQDKFEKDCVTYMKGHADFFVSVSKSSSLCQVDAVIPNSVDLSRVCPRIGRDEVRKAWGVREDEKILLFCGRFVEEKWPEAPIQALQHLPKEWRVMYVGKGYQQADLIREAQRYHLHERVSFVPFQYYMGDIFKAADCFMLPSDFEGLPLTLLEAWMAGLPTVVSDMDVVLELCQDVQAQLSVIVPKRCTPQVLAEGVLASQTFDYGLATAMVWNEFNAPRCAYMWETFLSHALHKIRLRKNLPWVYPVEQIEPNTTSYKKRVKRAT